MKKTGMTLAAIALGAMAVSAQNLNVNCGNVIYTFPAENLGAVKFNEGSNFTVGNRTYNIEDVSSIEVDDEALAAKQVEIKYAGSYARVKVPGEIARYVDVTIDGANVSISQSEEVGDDTCGEITYRLSGNSANGSFKLTGAYKCSVDLAGVSLQSEIGAAVDIQNGKRVNLRVVEGTENYLVDSEGGSQKACLYCKGHMEFKQKGTLYVTGNTAHAISAKEYISIKNSKIYVLGSVKDGLNCNQYFSMESGLLDIKGAGDDGLQVSYKDSENREAEDTGTFTLTGGTINAVTTAKAAKAIKADGDIYVTGGSITAEVNGGGLWDTAKLKTKASSCLGADGIIDISGGDFTLSATGSGGKGMSCDGELHISGGDIVITTTGGMYAYTGGKEYDNYTGNADNLNSDYKSSSKGIKCDSNVTIDGGKICIKTSGNGAEGIESKANLTINDGIIRINAYDDGINCTGNMYINGGDIESVAQKNDGLDSNGNMYIAGGTIRAFGGSQPECGIDVNSEEGYKLYFTGGYIMGVGGGSSYPSNSQSTQPYISASLSSVTAGSTVTISEGTETLASFEVPSSYILAPAYTPAMAGGRPGGTGGGMGGKTVVISVPGMTVGTTYTVTCGTASTTAAAVQYGSSSSRPW